MDSAKEIDRIARIIVSELRDRSIFALDRRLSGWWGGRTTERWNEIITTEQIRSAITYVIPDIVDSVISATLRLLEDTKIEFYIKTIDGEIVDIRDIGQNEMSGDYLGDDDGWIRQYSKQRYHNDDRIQHELVLRNSAENGDEDIEANR